MGTRQTLHLRYDKLKLDKIQHLYQKGELA